MVQRSRVQTDLHLFWGGGGGGGGGTRNQFFGMRQRVGVALQMTFVSCES